MPDAVQNPHPLIRIPALLCGSDGTNARCFVESWKEHSSTGKTYTRCRITDDPTELPEGEYIVEFAEQSLRTFKHHGKWALTFLAPDMEITTAAA